MMIVTVTMNPAIDKTVEIDRLERGGLNRISHVEIDAGGKGINVSKAIHELGGQSIAVGFIAGSTGKMIRSVMDELKMILSRCPARRGQTRKFLKRQVS